MRKRGVKGPIRNLASQLPHAPDPDLNAANTLSDPDSVGLLDNLTIRLDAGIATISLPPVSWIEVRISAPQPPRQ